MKSKKIVFAYLFISYLFSFLIFFERYFFSPFYVKDFFFYVMLFFGLFVAGFLMYINFILFFNKGKINSKYLSFNLVGLLFQVVTISIFGVSYDYVYGIRFTPYLVYFEDIEFRILLDAFDFKLRIFYQKSSTILFGVNLIPLVLFLILAKGRKSL